MDKLQFLVLIYITFDPLVYENVCMITSLPTKRQRYHSENIYQSFTHKMARKPTGIEITSLSPYVGL